MNKVNKYTRAPSGGKEIQCPKCSETARVYHFSWCSIHCLHCETQIQKQEWLIPQERLQVQKKGGLEAPL